MIKGNTRLLRFYLTLDIVKLFGNLTTRLTLYRHPHFNIGYSQSFCHAGTHAASQRWQTFAQSLLHTAGLHIRLDLEVLSPITQWFCYARKVEVLETIKSAKSERSTRRMIVTVCRHRVLRESLFNHTLSGKATVGNKD